MLNFWQAKMSSILRVIKKAKRSRAAKKAARTRAINKIFFKAVEIGFKDCAGDKCNRTVPANDVEGLCGPCWSRKHTATI